MSTSGYTIITQIQGRICWGEGGGSWGQLTLGRSEGSLGTRPSKNRKGGSGTSAGVEVYTAPSMKVHFRLAFD